MARDKNKKQVIMQPTIENLAMVGEDIAYHLNIVRRLAPAVVLDENTRDWLANFQLWVGRVAAGDHRASIQRTLATGIGLERKLGDIIEVHFNSALSELTSLAADIMRKAPNLYALKGKEVEVALADFTAVVAKSEHLDQMVGAHNRCRDLLIPMRARMEDEVKRAERDKRSTANVAKEQRARKSLAALSEMRIA